MASAQRRGPAPIASFDHDASDESSPESRRGPPEPPEPRARALSTPAGALRAPPAPRIDISRASSSSHHDSRDSSPELALFAGAGALGFREDGALDLRSSTEELAFLEGAPAGPVALAAAGPPAGPPAPAGPARRPSRRDSQGSEVALLAVSGRTSRVSSVGSQCSALSGLSHVSRLSVLSGASRSPSPHRMLLETSFCGPKPIENDPDVCTAAVEERLLEMAKLSAAPPAVDARDRREVRTKATVEREVRTEATVKCEVRTEVTVQRETRTDAIVECEASTEATVASEVRMEVAADREATAPPEPSPGPASPDDDKKLKESRNRARAHERRARPRVRREPSEPEVYKSGNRTKDIIRIRLKPDDQYEDDDEVAAASRQPVAVAGDAGARAERPTRLAGCAEAEPGSPGGRRESRTPSPQGPPVSRKSSFCSLFKSRETIASPDSPSGALLRKRSLTEGRSRSKSRERSATPSSAGKVRGSVLSLFRTPRRSAASPSPSSREGSPALASAAPAPPAPPERPRLKYYEDAGDIIHIPLRTPPDEQPGSQAAHPASQPARPASAPHEHEAARRPVARTVLPDGSIIIPLRSPTERAIAEGPVGWAGDAPEPETPATPAVGSVPETVAPAAGGRRDGAVPASVAPVGGKVAAVPEPTAASYAAADSPPSERPALGSDGAADVESPEPAEPRPAAGLEAEGDEDEARHRRRERLVFTTHVGSREQVFSTRLSITTTPSVTDEAPGAFPGPADVARRDSSGSEPSSGSAAPARGGDEAERRGLVVQESFEDELPYVPTTLPQERSLALPMVPVRERGARLAVAGVSRPRAPRQSPAAPAPALAPTPVPASAPYAEKLRIHLPRRPRTASASTPARPDRARTRSGGDGGEPRAKADWIDFEEVPERRKQPKRIQTLPAAGTGEGGAGAASYVEPEHCRCECHAQARDERPERLRLSCPEPGPPAPAPAHGAPAVPTEARRGPRAAATDAEARHAHLL